MPMLFTLCPEKKWTPKTLSIIALYGCGSLKNLMRNTVQQFFRLDALALSVIANATWLAGWLAGWLSVTAGIVSKRLNVSENFFDHLIAPS